MRKGERTIVVAGVKWNYAVGSYYVRIAKPGTIHTVTIPALKGVSVETFERGRWKRTSDGAVTPSEIRAFLERVR